MSQEPIGAARGDEVGRGQVWISLEGETLPWAIPGSQADDLGECPLGGSSGEAGLQEQAKPVDRGALLESVRSIAGVSLEGRGGRVPEDPTAAPARPVEGRPFEPATQNSNTGSLICAESGSSRPPGQENTGLPPGYAPGELRTGIDWVSLSFRRPSGGTWERRTPQEVVDRLAVQVREFFPHQVDPERDPRGAWYAKVGVFLGVLDRRGWDGRLQVKGAALGSIGAAEWRAWFLRLEQAGWTLRSSRLDVFTDGDRDAGVPSPGKFKGMVDNPKLCRFVTRVRPSKSRRRPGLYQWHQGRDGGSTLSFGTRGGSAQRFLRIYDKAAELDLPSGVDLTRIELELKGDSANSAFRHWMLGESAGRIWASHIRGYVSFRNPQTGREFAWWLKLLGDAPQAMIGARKPSTIKGSILYLSKVFARAIVPSLGQVPLRQQGGALKAFIEQVFRFSLEERPLRSRGPAHVSIGVDLLQDAMEGRLSMAGGL